MVETPGRFLRTAGVIYPLPLGEGAKRDPDRTKPKKTVRVSVFAHTCDPHPPLRGDLSQRER